MRADNQMTRRQRAIIAKVVIDVRRPRNPTGDQRRCPVINDMRVNDLAAPTALNSMSHFRHMQFLSLSSWRYTRPENALSTFCIVTPRISARVCLSALRIDFKSFNELILFIRTLGSDFPQFSNRIGNSKEAKF